MYSFKNEMSLFLVFVMPKMRLHISNSLILFITAYQLRTSLKNMIRNSDLNGIVKE